MSTDTDSNPGRILVVDDGKMARVLLTRQLTGEGYAVTEAVSGEEALEALEALAPDKFDLIILDVLMPGIGGIETLEKIREQHSREELPIIMATAQDQVDSMLKAFELGANDYIVKPVLFPILRARLRTMLDLLNAQRQLKAAQTRLAELEAKPAS